MKSTIWGWHLPLFTVLMVFITIIVALNLSVSVDACCDSVCCGECEKQINASANITVPNALLRVEKIVYPETFEQNDLVKFHIEVINIGNAPAYKLNIVDVLDKNLHYTHSIYDTSSSNYGIYKFVFNSSNNAYECQNAAGQWTTNWNTCVLQGEDIAFYNFSNNKLLWKGASDSDGKTLPAKTAFVIEFFARAKENASIGNFTNNVSVSAQHNKHLYDCSGVSDNPACTGGVCKTKDGSQGCTINNCYCDGCQSPPQGCISTELSDWQYVGFNLPNNQKLKLNDTINFTIIPKTQIFIDKSINSINNVFRIGDVIPFVLNINSNVNLTNATLNNVTIIDSLPLGIKFLNATLSRIINGTEINKTLNSTTNPKLTTVKVNNRDVLTFVLENFSQYTDPATTFKIYINAQATTNASCKIENTANVSAIHLRHYETRYLSDDASTVFFVAKNTHLKISKDSLTSTVSPGANVTYEILLLNDGEVPAVNITINDTLPCNFTYIVNSTTIEWGSSGYENFTSPNASTKNPIFTISVLNGSSYILFRYNVLVPENIGTGMLCRNLAKFTAKNLNGDNISGHDRASVYISQTPAYLQVNKEVVNNKLFEVRDVVVYKIKVRNSGGQKANDVQLKDFLPLNMKFENITTPGYEYLFDWNKVPGNDSNKVLNFLRDGLNVGWADNSTGNILINKSNDNKTINISNNATNNSVLFELNIAQSSVILNFSNGTKIYFILRNETSNLNVYRDANVSFGCGKMNITGDPWTSGEILTCNIGTFEPDKTKIYYLSTKIIDYTQTFVNKVEVNGSTLNGEQWFKDSFAIYVGKPRLMLEKKGELNPRPGDTTTYQLFIKNDGNVPAYNVSVTDRLPINWKRPPVYEWYWINCFNKSGNLIGQMGQGMNASSNQINIPGGSDIVEILNFTKKYLEPGEYCSISYDVNVPKNAQEGVYVNYAVANAKNKFGVDVERTKAKVYSNVRSYPDFIVIKTINATSANVGDKIRVDIKVLNNGNVPLNISVVDLLPPGFSNLTKSSFKVSLNPGSSTSHSIGVYINANASDGLNINIVKANASTANKQNIYREDIAYIYINSSKLEMEKFSKQLIYNPGDTAKFYIKIKNVGNGIARNISLFDKSKISNFSLDVNNTNCSSLVLGNYPNIITGGTLNPGKECLIAYTLIIPENICYLIKNEAILNWTGNGKNYSIRESTYVFAKSNPSIFIAMLPNTSKADINENVMWNIVVKNNGNVRLNVTLKDVMPDSLINLTQSSFFLTLNPGEMKEYNVTTRTNSAGIIENVIKLNASSPCNELIEKEAKAAIYVGKPLLLINKWTTTPNRLPGQTAEFFILVKNDGNGKAINVTLTDKSNLTNPSSIVFYSGNCSSLVIGNYPNLITGGNLMPDQYCILHYNMSVQNVGGYSNTATLMGKDNKGNLLNLEKSTAYVNAGIITPSIIVDKTCNATEAGIGDRVNFSVKVTNIGNINVTIISMNETLPIGFNCTFGNWSKITLQPNETAKRSINCLILSNASEGVNTNEVRVTVESDGGIKVSQSDNAFLIVNKQKLKLKKHGPLNAKPGDRKTPYKLVIKNDGNVVAYNVSVTDTLPMNWKVPSHEWYQIDCFGKTGSQIGQKKHGMNASSKYIDVGKNDAINVLNFTKESLNPGDYCDIFYYVNISAKEKTGIYENVAKATAKDKLGNDIKEDYDDSDKAGTLVLNYPSFFLSVTPDKFYVSKGGIVRFKISVVNLGDTAINVSMNNVLPPGFKNMSPTHFALRLGVGQSATRNVRAKVLNDTNSTITGMHLNKVVAFGETAKGTKIEESAYCAIYITSTPLSVIAEVDDKAIYQNSTVKFRLTVINPSMFDTYNLNISAMIPSGLEYVENSTMINGIPYNDPSIEIFNNGTNFTQLTYDGLMIYSKSIKVIKFNAIVKNTTPGHYDLPVSMIYLQHNEIGQANTTLSFDVYPDWNYVPDTPPRLNFYVFKDEIFSPDKVVKYSVIIPNDFNELANKNVAIEFSNNNSEILTVMINSVPIDMLLSGREGYYYYLNLSSALDKLKKFNVSLDKLEIKYIVKPYIKQPKIYDIIKVHTGNETMEIPVISDLLIPPSGITVQHKCQNCNVSYILGENPVNFTLRLKEGWNLVGIPIKLNTTSLYEILKPIEGKYTDVFAYKNSWSYKSIYMNKWFGDLNTIENCLGYWIMVNEDVNLTLQGYEIKNFSMDLYNGWNLVSVPILENITVTENESKIDNYTDIFTYNAYNNKWIYRSKYMNKWFGDLENTEAGRGYWIKVDNYLKI